MPPKPREARILTVARPATRGADGVAGLAPAPDFTPRRVVRTQAERSAATRARLVNAAIDRLCRLGYAATSTVVVADMARVSRGAMLHQFATKADLMARVIETSYAGDIEAYRLVVTQTKDPVARLLAVIDAAWRQFRSPAGIAQAEIWMATRSDPELAAAVLPVHAAMFANSRSTYARLLAQAGITGIGVSDALLYHHVAALRGLAMEHVLGTPEEVLHPSVKLIKDQVLAIIAGSWVPTAGDASA